MTKLLWSQAGQRFFETGIDRGVLYLADGTAIPWNGLTSFEEDLGNDIVTSYFADGVKYLDATSTGDFAGTLKAYTYPDEFFEYEGVVESNYSGLFVDDQPARPFNLSFRTLIGNDLNSNLGYKLHLCYGLSAVLEDSTYQTLGEQPTALEFSWKITSTPENVSGYAPTAHVIIDSRYVYPYLLADLEAILYGDDNADASLPTITDLLAYVGSWALIKIIDNGDGTWTASGPDDLVMMTDDTTFAIHGANATYLDANTYTISDTYVEQGG